MVELIKNELELAAYYSDPKNNPSFAIECCTKVIGFANSLSSEFQLYCANAYHRLALIYECRNDVPNAEQSYFAEKETLEKLVENGNFLLNEQLAEVHISLGKLYLSVLSNEKAEQNFFVAIEISNKMLDKNYCIAYDMIADYEIIIADFYCSCGDKAKAKQHYLRCAKFCEILPEKTKKSNLKQRLADYYGRISDFFAETHNIVLKNKFKTLSEKYKQ